MPLAIDYATLMSRAKAKAATLPRPPHSLRSGPLWKVREWQLAEAAKPARAKVAVVPRKPVVPPWSAAAEMAGLEAEFPGATVERQWEIAKRMKALCEGAGPLPPGFETVTEKRKRLESELAVAGDDEARMRISRELLQL